MLMTSFTASPVVVKLIHIDLLMCVLLGCWWGIKNNLTAVVQKTDFNVCTKYVEVCCFEHVLPNSVVVVLNGEHTIELYSS